jgi:hypothetical protein
MKKTTHDWSRADAMTDEEIHAAALADPDGQPLTPERLTRMKRRLRSGSSAPRLVCHRRNSRGAFRYRSAPCGIGNRGAKTLTPPPALTLSGSGAIPLR